MAVESTQRECTRTRVLKSACAVFAAKGYRDATVAEICERAGANVASVNYHFRDKESLYAEVWRDAHQRAFEAFPADGGLPDDATAEQRLGAHVRALLQRVLCPGEAGQFAHLLLREMVEPTSALQGVLDEAIRPQRDRTIQIVRELLGEDASEFQVRLTVMSIVNQCLAFAFTKPVREHFSGRADLEEVHMEKLADHVLRFSLAGIREIRRSVAEGNNG